MSKKSGKRPAPQAMAANRSTTVAPPAGGGARLGLLRLAQCLLLPALGISLYLAYQSLSGGGIAGCGAGSDCSTVLTSRWAYWFSLPVSVPAALVYIAVLVASFFVGVGLSGVTVLPNQVLVSRWFSSRVGLVNGILLGATATGAAISPALITRLIEASDWRSAFAWMAIFALAPPLLVTLFVVRDRPEDMGLEPYGAGQATADATDVGLAPAQVLRTGVFWAFALIILLGGMPCYSINKHILVFLRELGFDPVSAADYIDALRLRGRLTRRTLEAFAVIDAALTVSGMDPPCPIDDAEACARMYPRQARQPFNVTGQPAIAIPAGFTASGLPLSLQLAGHPWQEATLYRIAHAYERATLWIDRRPPGL